MNLFNEEDELESFNKNLEQFIQQQNLKKINVSDLKISIMSATSSFNTILNLKTLSVFLKKNHNIYEIDSTFNMTRKVSNIAKKKIFYNQLPIKIRPYYDNTKKININLIINLKLFRNGRIQMCGLRSENDGYLSVKILLKELNKIIQIQKQHINIFKYKLNSNVINNLVNKLYNLNIYLIDYNTYNTIINKNNKYNIYSYYNLKNKCSSNVINKLIKKNNEMINITKYNITLINSDFCIGFKINRTNIYNYILNDCGLLCDYDPCIYQGVLIKFYWNYNKNIQDGKCNCSIPCNGKGVGLGDGECRKITVSIFQSGNIIITGKCNRDEIQYIYKYIIDLLYDNYENIKQISFMEDETNIKIKRRNISILINKQI